MPYELRRVRHYHRITSREVLEERSGAALKRFFDLLAKCGQEACRELFPRYETVRANEPPQVRKGVGLGIKSHENARSNDVATVFGHGCAGAGKKPESARMSERVGLDDFLVEEPSPVKLLKGNLETFPSGHGGASRAPGSGSQGASPSP